MQAVRASSRTSAFCAMTMMRARTAGGDVERFRVVHAANFESGFDEPPPDLTRAVGALGDAFDDRGEGNRRVVAGR